MMTFQQQPVRFWIPKFRFWLIASSLLVAYPAWAEGVKEIADDSHLSSTPHPTQPIIQPVSDKAQVSTSVTDLLAQEPGNVVAIEVTGVQLKPTPGGLEVILETAGTFEEVLTSSAENSLITDIPNAQLRLPKGGVFRRDNPTQDIVSVEVTNLDAKTIRVTVTGKAGVPTAEVSQSPQALILSVAAPPAPAPSAPPAQPTPTPAPEQQAPPPAAPQPEAKEEELVEFEVRAEEEAGSYDVPDATTATKTDTPIRDIPASIQVVPQQVLKDQNTTRIQDALQNVSGVAKAGDFGGTDAGGFNIRGFYQDGNFRNGFRDNDFYSVVDEGNIERIEVLKGPASVLYGQVEPGGIVNVITKQPLDTPYYSASFTVGNYAFYRPSIDLSGPLTSDGSLLYRLNLAYQNSKSFRDFNFTDRVLVAPVFTWNISDRTSLTLEFEYLNNRYRYDRGIPAIGDRPADIPIDRFLGYPSLDEDDPQNDRSLRASYVFQHQFNDDWKLRNALSISSLRSTGLSVDINFDEPLVDDRFQGKELSDGDFIRDNYTLQTELTGKFNTGSVVHRPLLGVELNRRTVWYEGFTASLPAIDIFDPNYDVTRPDLPETPTYNTFTPTNTLGIYLQDQITLADNLKLLIGGRFDTTSQENNDFISETSTDQADSAFSPRVGIVYQPIVPISLYASYSQSFLPVIGLSRTNTPFEPQRGTGYEVGIKAEINEQLAATLAAYQITKTNVLTTDPVDADFSIQVGEQRSRGLELDVGGEVLPGLNLIASYAYTDAITTEDEVIPVGNRLEDVPPTLPVSGQPTNFRGVTCKVWVLG